MKIKISNNQFFHDYIFGHVEKMSYKTIKMYKVLLF